VGPLHSVNSGAFVPAPARPRRIAGACWQAGVTEGNEQVKVLLDGEPVVGAVAASVGEGWVLVQPEPELEPVKCNSRAPMGLAYRIDPFLAPVKRTGVVTLVEPGGSSLPTSKEGTRARSSRH
jgi:hypothetical protein